MIRRRSAHDPLADRTHAHWLVCTDLHGQILECQPIAPGADLRAVLAQTRERLAAEGWTIEQEGRLGSFFCHREGVRRFVHLRPTDPHAPLYGASRLLSCPDRDA